jgi:alpha-glucoside transport system substrate-binding protein
MRKQHRWYLLFALVLALSAVAAGCGGGDEEEGGGGTETGGGAVSGTLSMVAVWTGAEGESFQAVLDGFKEQFPNVTVRYQGSADPATVLSTAIEGGNPPDLAALPNPGLMKDFQSRGVIQPIDFARDDAEANFSQSWVDLGSIDGQLYGVFFKGGNKSTVWYNVHAFEDAGIEPPADWDAFLAAAQTLKASGVPAYSIGAADGWTLTDWFEQVYLRLAGPEKYDQLTNHEIPWTDPSVKDALTELAKVFGDTDNIAGGTSGALQTDFPTSISQIYADPPKAAIAYEGDFAAGVITDETQAQPQKDFDFFDFPSVNGSSPSVVGGGDVVVMFKDSPAAQALVKYLATPEAAEIWAKRGGFSSPNKNVDESVYPDEITRRAATALAQAETFRFDMSDLAPSAFGSDAEFSLLQDWFKNPDDVDGATAKLEAAAKKAYGS